MRNQPVTAFKPGDRVHHAPLLRTGTIRSILGHTLAFIDWDEHLASYASTTHLTPAGEPMTTTFESIDHCNDGVTVGRNSLGVLIGIKRDGKTQQALTVSTGTAPAFVLAVLDEAGVEPLSEHYGDNNDPDVALRHAAHFLTKHAALTEAKAKEAADREALDRRREDLAHEFAENPGGYAIAALSTQRAIDRIIELEAQATP